jgi:hypothetical protein
MTADTIAAIATARGRAALAVVRLSGPRAVAIADACLPGRDLAKAAGHTAHFGVFRDPAGARLDEVVATVFRAPNSPLARTWSRSRATAATSRRSWCYAPCSPAGPGWRSPASSPSAPS